MPQDNSISCVKWDDTTFWRSSAHNKIGLEINIYIIIYILMALRQTGSANVQRKCDIKIYNFLVLLPFII